MQFRVGDKVEYQRFGRQTWLSGVVDEIRRDKSLNILGPDNELERAIPPERVRQAPEPASDSKSDDTKISDLIKTAFKDKPVSTLRAKLTSALADHDLGGNGTVDEDGFYSALKELRVPLTRSELSTLFKRFESAGDVNCRAFVTYCMDELSGSDKKSSPAVEAVKLPSSLSAAVRAAASRVPLPEITTAFKHYDRKQTGKVSARDFRSALKDAGVSLSTSDEMDVVDALRSKEDSSLLSYDAFLAFLGSVREEGESDGKTPEPSAPSKLSTSGVGSSTAKSTRERSVDVEESKTPSARRQRVANLSPRFTDACRQIFRDGAGKVTQESIMSTFKTYSDDPEDDRSPTVKKISQAGFKRALQKLKVVFPEPDLKAIYTAFHDGSDDDGVSASEFITWITANTDKPAVASTASDPVFPIPDALVKTLRSKLTAAVRAGRAATAVEAFEAHDTDRTNKISRRDFSAALRTLKIELDLDDTRTLFKAVDPNADQIIMYRQLVSFVMRDSEPSGASGKPTPAVSDKILTELRSKFDAAIDSKKFRSYNDVFAALDSDDSGKVTRRQFDNCLRDVKVRLSFDENASLVRALDPSNVGSIDYRAFVKLLKNSGDAPDSKHDDEAVKGSSKGTSDKLGSAKPVRTQSDSETDEVRPLPGSRNSSKSTPAVSDKILTELRSKFDAAVDSKKFRSYNDVFSAVDSDDSGKVTRRQFDNCLRDVKVRLSFDENASLVRALDPSNVGSIDYRTFVKLLKGPDAPPAEQTSNQREPQERAVSSANAGKPGSLPVVFLKRLRREVADELGSTARRRLTDAFRSASVSRTPETSIHIRDFTEKLEDFNIRLSRDDIIDIKDCFGTTDLGTEIRYLDFISEVAPDSGEATVSKSRQGTDSPERPRSRRATPEPVKPRRAADSPEPVKPRRVADSPEPVKPRRVADSSEPVKSRRAVASPEPVKPRRVADSPEPVKSRRAAASPEPVKPRRVADSPEPVKPRRAADSPEPVKSRRAVASPEPVKPRRAVASPEPVKPRRVVDSPEPVKPRRVVASPEPVKPRRAVDSPEPIKPRRVVDSPEPLKPRRVVDSPEPAKAKQSDVVQTKQIVSTVLFEDYQEVDTLARLGVVSFNGTGKHGRTRSYTRLFGSSRLSSEQFMACMEHLLERPPTSRERRTLQQLFFPKNESDVDPKLFHDFCDGAVLFEPTSKLLVPTTGSRHSSVVERLAKGFLELDKPQPKGPTPCFRQAFLTGKQAESMSAAQFQGLLSARGIPTELSSSEITNVSTAFSAADGVVDVLAFLRAIEACIRRQSAPVYTGSDAEVMGAIGSKLLSHVNFAVEAGEMRALEDELRRREEEGYVSVVHFLAALDVGHVVMSESDLARLCGILDPSSTHRFRTSRLLDGLFVRPTPAAIVSARAPVTAQPVKWDDTAAASIRGAFDSLVATGRVRSLYDAFRAADHGKKGHLSADDFHTACSAVGVVIKPSEIQKIMARFDSNNDGFLDLEEFISFLDATAKQASARAPEAESTPSWKSLLCQRLAGIRASRLPTLLASLGIGGSSGSDDAVSRLQSVFSRHDDSNRGSIPTKSILSVLSAYRVDLSTEDIQALRSGFRVRSAGAPTAVDYKRLCIFVVGSSASCNDVLSSVEREALARESSQVEVKGEPVRLSGPRSGVKDVEDEDDESPLLSILANMGQPSQESLGSWLWTAASPAERKNLMKFLTAIDNFEQKLGLQQPRHDPLRAPLPHRPAMPSGFSSFPSRQLSSSVTSLPKRAFLSDDDDELLPSNSVRRPVVAAPAEPDTLVLQLGTKLRAGIRFFVVE